MYELSLMKLMVDHSVWMNRKLYQVCSGVPDRVRKQDKGLFFRSLHGTFNHLLLVDRLWLGRIAGKPLEVLSLDQELHADFETLKKAQKKTDDDLVALVASLTPEQLAERVTYRSLLRKTFVTLPLGLILTHVFHHRTHHRGQITALLSQLDYDVGDTDMIYMPAAKDGYF